MLLRVAWQMQALQLAEQCLVKISSSTASQCSMARAPQATGFKASSFSMFSTSTGRNTAVGGSLLLRPCVQQHAHRHHHRARRTFCSAAAATHASKEVEYEAVIGIETHVQLLTKTKAFCGCPSEFGAEPNSNVCPVCLGHPGTLPVVNQEMVVLAVRAGLALGCEIARKSKWDRKQYFYPDLPKGYQVSQYDEPICRGGQLEVQLADGSKKSFGIERAHLEEDSGKTVYVGADRMAGSEYGLVDFNRAGVPLLEIVSAPDMRTGRDAYAYGDELRRVLRFLGVSDGNMSEGSMRCDVNISVRPVGRPAFGTKVEIKNMNSFSNMQRAIEYEFERQVSLIRSGRGEEIVGETRLWDEFKHVTYSMRKKEGQADYRFFPEPDLPPITVTDEFIDHVRATLPELPAAVRERYAALGLTPAEVATLSAEPGSRALFDGLLAAGVAPRAACNWLVGDVQAACKEKKVGMESLAITPAALAEMIALIDDGTISGKIAKEVLPELLDGAGNGGVKAYIQSRGLLQISDEAAVAALVAGVLAAHPKQVDQFRKGKNKLQAFFEGQVMKESKGRVNPVMMKEILIKQLKGEQ